VTSEPILKIAKDVLAKAKTKGLECVVGGGVSDLSIPFFKAIPRSDLDFFETRKVIFKCPEAIDNDAEKGILKAVSFELLWLENKRDFYGMIFSEDKARIDMLQKRYSKLVGM
jgi:hypothetical protein